MHVRFSGTAEADLDHIHDYVNEHDPIAANRVVDRILATAYQLEAFPLLGHEGRVPETRELIVPRLSYIIVYTLPDEYHVDIETIIHTSRKYPPGDE